MNLDSMKDILAAVRREEKPIWEIIIETDMENRGVTREDSMARWPRHGMRCWTPLTPIMVSATVPAVW